MVSQTPWPTEFAQSQENQQIFDNSFNRRSLGNPPLAFTFPMPFMPSQQTAAAEGWLTQDLAALPELGENGPARGRKCFSHPVFRYSQWTGSHKWEDSNTVWPTEKTSVDTGITLYEAAKAKTCGSCPLLCCGHSHGNLLSFSISSSKRGSGTKFLQNLRR